jgi:SAM-dependent methyltransferase
MNGRESLENTVVQQAADTAYMGETASAYDAQRFVSRAGLRVHRAERQMMLDALRQVPNGSAVLEVGCGTGRLLVEAAEAGATVTGADASPEMLAQAQARLPDARFELAPAHALPFEDAAFDLTYSIRLLNQTESPAYALTVVDEMVRVTRPGGFVLVEFVSAGRPIKPGRDVRLSPDQVIARGTAAGCGLVWVRGAFLSGMTVFGRLPGALRRLDATLGHMLPALCSRCYVLLRKP